MATYDYSEGTQAENALQLGYASVHACHVPKRKFDVDVVIAWNSVLAAAEKITSADIFKVIPVPDDTFVYITGYKIITAFTGSDIDIGWGGGDQFQDGTIAESDPSGTVGDHCITAHDDEYGPDFLTGYVFTTADTIDLTFNADEADGTGSILIYAITFDVADDVGTD